MQSFHASIDSTSSASELARTLSDLDAVVWISQAIKKLLPETVKKCFEKAGFCKSAQDAHSRTSR
jgi:hypothetical protein